MMMGGLWSRLFIVAVLIGVAAASRPLAFFMIGAAWLTLIGLILYKAVYKGRYLPQIVLNALDSRERSRREASLKDAKLTTLDAEELAKKLKARVVGQDRVIDQMARTLRRRFMARRPNKPLAVFCFAGPPGVGKTHLAKVLAETLYGDPQHLHFVDMSQNSASSLFGSPKGYLGSDSYGQVTAALRDVPNSVLLLDEFEKADREVHTRFLTAWNDGFVTEVSDGAKFATNETIFILTTNAAALRIGELSRDHTGDAEELNRLVKSTLADAQFAPEVLSRIDEVFPFGEMSGLDIARVVALEIENIAKQFDLEVAEAGIDPQILIAAIDKASAAGAKGGVREIARELERQIADGLVDARLAGATHVRFTADGVGIHVIPVGNESGPPGPTMPFATIA
jgi:ATP-dependent Clp protease ATP-binding subunit ClpA